MDDYAFADLREYGCPAERLVITGQPYLDSLLAEVSAVDQQAVRQGIGIQPDDFVVVFASESLSGDGRPGPNRDYTEFDGLRCVIGALSLLDGLNPLLLVKPHPTEDPKGLRRVIEAAASRSMIIDHLSPREVIAIADVVVGMRSMMLVEAALAGRVTLSVFPYEFIGNRLRLTCSVTDVTALSRALTTARALGRQGMAIGHEPLGDGHAAARIISAAIELAGF
jgi:hypothetical protein